MKKTTTSQHIDKLSALIVDALEDIKGQDIVVYDTTALTSMFDRVVIASGTSNRQTRSLANNVRERVKGAGFTVGNIEGEDTGEWVLLDCVDAIVHVMQPAIRQYYRLEEIWGGKLVDVKAIAKITTGRVGKARAKVIEAQAEAQEVQAKADAAKAAAKKAAPKKVAAKKVVAKSAPAKSAPAKTAPAKKPAAKKPAAKPVATAAKKAPAKKVAAKAVPAKKLAGTRPAVNKPAVKRPAAKKASPKR